MIKGVIEGFYGPPWSHQERLSCIDNLALWGANTYVWAAKLEPHHRQLSQEAFTPQEILRFGELCSRSRHIKIIIGLTPAADTTRQQVIDKLAPVIGVGCHGIALCFDDLPGLDAGLHHRQLATAILQEFSCAVYIVPTHYAGICSSAYLDQLCQNLDEKILVMWTGMHVVNTTITSHEARQRAYVCGDRLPLLWDNTPVNDALMSEALHMGPYAGRDLLGGKDISGLLINPMEFFQASMPTTRSAMAWCAGEDPLLAWEQYVDDRGWRLVAQATAFPDDPHWPGARPNVAWWQSVATMTGDGLDPGCAAWIAAAQEGANLYLRARRLIDSPMQDAQAHAMALIGLAMAWRAWERSPYLVFGKGPRIRPILSNDESGRFTFDPRTVVLSTSLVEDEIRRALDLK